MTVNNMTGEYDLVLFGLGVMGENFIRNFASKGFRVIGVNRTVAVTERFAAEVAGEPIADMVGTAETLEDACKHLKQPGGAVLAMIKANDPVNEAWGGIDDLFFKGSIAKLPDGSVRNVGALVDIIPEGTVIIDAANSHPHDTQRRTAMMRERGVLFVGTGVSGGAEGALLGPSIMPGGMREAYDVVGGMLEAVAAQTEGACCMFVGNAEAGHFVKMVHNGIEYGIMQAISEVYFALGQLLDIGAQELHEIFVKMTDGRHGGYLMEISRDALGMTDRESGKPVLDVILDRAGQKGTGKWTSQVAFDLGVPVPTIAAALQARIMSSYKPQRVAAADMLTGVAAKACCLPDRGRIIAAAADALYGAMIASYSQGFWMLREAHLADPAEHNGRYDFPLDMAEIARIWKGGCIIRSKMLRPIRKAFLADAELVNIMLAPELAGVLNDAEFQQNWRTWTALMADTGLPCGTIAASLDYFDTYRTARLPANMIQAQRDTFGQHGFERTDKDGKGYHLEPA
jgi:6-phosphogluconate dehydrogenase